MYQVVLRLLHCGKLAPSVRTGKLAAAMAVAEFDQLMARLDYLPLPVSHRHGLRGGSLPGQLSR